MLQLPPIFKENQILAALDKADQDILFPCLMPVVLKNRQHLESSNQQIKAVYFITTGLAHVMAVDRGRRHQAGVVVVGSEGMTGIPVVMGTDRSPNDTVFHHAGVGYSITSDDLREAMAKSASLSRTILRYAHVFYMQASYAALANAQASVEERLARYLLMAHDRTTGDDLSMTHEFLAHMLNVRRSSVTLSLHQLLVKDLLSMGRGTIEILDRAGLEEAANGSYGIPEAEFARLFPTPPTRYDHRDTEKFLEVMSS